MTGNHFSIILLPTNRRNVNCDYCFENKTGDRLTLDRLIGASAGIRAVVRRPALPDTNQHRRVQSHWT
jgi:hypothetical protein